MGRDDFPPSDHTERAGLVERLAARGRHTLFARGEWADRSLLGMNVVIHPDGFPDHDKTLLPYDVSQLSIGYGVRVARPPTRSASS